MPEFKKRPQLNDACIESMSLFLKALSDPTRIKILFILEEFEELSVGDIVSKVKMTDSAVSHQLRILRQVNLVKNRRDGKTIYYSLSDDHVKTVLAQTIDHVMEP